MKKEELGAIRKRFSCPEKYSTQAPLWKDILFNLIPVLIVGFMIASLANGAGMSAAGAYVVGALVTAGFTFFSVFVTRAWKKRYEESYMTLQEKGISGVCPVNAFHSKEFAVAYNEIRNVRLPAASCVALIPLTTDGSVSKIPSCAFQRIRSYPWISDLTSRSAAALPHISVKKAPVSAVVPATTSLS